MNKVYEDLQKNENILEFDGYEYDYNENDEMLYDWEEFKKMFDVFLEENQVMTSVYLITGQANRWDGIHEAANAQFIFISELQELLNSLENHDINSINIKLKNNGNIYYRYTHHDGVNEYNFIHLANFTEKQLRNFIESDKSIKEEYEEIYEKYGHDKETLIEAIEYFYLWNK